MLRSYVAPAARPLSALFSAFCFSLCAICWHAVTLPPNGNKSTGRSAARGIEHARRGGCLPSEGTAGHCPSLGDSVRYGNVRHIHSTLAAKEDHLAQVLLLHRPQTQTKSSPAVRQGHQVLGQFDPLEHLGPLDAVGPSTSRGPSPQEPNRATDTDVMARPASGPARRS